MRLPRRPPRIHHRNSPRLARGNRQISFMHPDKERSRLLLESVFIVPATGTFRISPVPLPRSTHTRRRVRIQQNRQIRLQIATQYTMQLPHRLTPQLASAALVSLRRISKPIAEHDASLRQRQLNHFRNMLRPRSKHQRHLGQRRQPRRPRVEQHLANLFSRRRPAWLARLNNGMPCRAHHRRQLSQLRALASPVQPFKRNKFSAPRHPAESYQSAFDEQFPALTFFAFSGAVLRKLCA
jgi:hypothetical protein